MWPFFKFYAQRVGRFGKAALGLFCGGGILLAVGHVGFMSALRDYVPAFMCPYIEYLFLLVLVGMLCLLSGLIWFGILNLRKPVLTRWQWLPWQPGSWALSAFFSSAARRSRPSSCCSAPCLPSGLIGLGLILWLEKPVQPEVKGDAHTLQVSDA